METTIRYVLVRTTGLLLLLQLTRHAVMASEVTRITLQFAAYFKQPVVRDMAVKWGITGAVSPVIDRLSGTDTDNIL